MTNLYISGNPSQLQTCREDSGGRGKGGDAPSLICRPQGSLFSAPPESPQSGTN
jgi:hypothetical protein